MSSTITVGELVWSLTALVITLTAGVNVLEGWRGLRDRAIHNGRRRTAMMFEIVSVALFLAVLLDLFLGIVSMTVPTPVTTPSWRSVFTPLAFVAVLLFQGFTIELVRRWWRDN